LSEERSRIDSSGDRDGGVARAHLSWHALSTRHVFVLYHRHAIGWLRLASGEGGGAAALGVSARKASPITDGDLAALAEWRKAIGAGSEPSAALEQIRSLLPELTIADRVTLAAELMAGNRE
jgi:hypothetical protein